MLCSSCRFLEIHSFPFLFSHNCRHRHNQGIILYRATPETTVIIIFFTSTRNNRAAAVSHVFEQNRLSAISSFFCSLRFLRSGIVTMMVILDGHDDMIWWYDTVVAWRRQERYAFTMTIQTLTHQLTKFTYYSTSVIAHYTSAGAFSGFFSWWQYWH